jgi:hypothetical protein
MKDLKNNQGWGGRRPGTGGARPGAGMPKGYKTKKTIAKEKAQETARAMITAELEPMIKAQIALAMGESHFLLRDKKTKQWELITDPAVIEKAERTGKDGIDYHWIFTKDPSVEAFKELLNWALGKPAKQMKVTGRDSGPVILNWFEELKQSVPLH